MLIIVQNPKKFFVRKDKLVVDDCGLVDTPVTLGQIAKAQQNKISN